MDTASVLDRTGRVLRERGPGALAALVLRRLAHPVVASGAVTFFVKELGPEAQARPLNGFRVRQLWASDKAALLHGSESDWETLLARFRLGNLCFGALDEQGRAVHTRWVTLTRALIPELAVDFAPTAEAAYFYDGYTRPEARRQGVDAGVRGVIFEAMRALGRERVYSYVRDDNPAGLRAAGRSQRALGTIRYVRVFGSKPLRFGSGLPPLAALLREPAGVAARDASERAGDWRRWFEGWLQEPLARRSIGFHELPTEAFEAMAGHIRGALGLDPARDLVLDVGCDSALVSRQVAPHCARLVGVDFIAGMLLDAARRRGSAAPLPPNMCFAAADGRQLPFPAATFPKAYCSGVVHTLPSREDGVAMILDLVRVTRPGGQVLVAAVPDTRKRWRARRAAFRAGGLGQRLQIALSAALPASWKRLARRLVPGLPREGLVYLEYDLRQLKARLEGRGLACTILDYPADFWSRDFRETRSNLLIAVPPTPGPL
jgi:hypothetical protein